MPRSALYSRFHPVEKILRQSGPWKKRRHRIVVDQCVSVALLTGQQGTDSRFCLTHLPEMIGCRTTGLAAVKKPEPHKPNPPDIQYR